MNPTQVKDSIGKTAIVNGFRDLGIDPDMRKIIGEEVTIIKQCKSGLVQIEREGKFYSIRMTNLDPIR